MMSSRIVMKLMDKNDLLKDVAVGSLLFNLKDCIDPTKNGVFFWKNVYGAPVGRSGSNCDMMNNNPEIASTWKGRVLMKVTAKKAENPVCKMRKLSKEEVKKAEEYFDSERELDVIAEVG